MANADWKRNSLGEIINQDNIDLFIPELDSTEINNILQRLRDTSASAQTDTGAWDKYFASLKNSDQDYLVDLIRNTEDLTRLTGEDLVKANQDARESAIAHNDAIRQSIKEQSLSAKATNFLASSLSALGNMAALALISKGVSLFAKKIDEAAHSAEYCKERVNSLMSSYESSLNQANNNAKSIERLAARYEELSIGVNNLGENISLSGAEYEEYQEIVNQIADMFPSLIQGYTDEGNAILSVKGNVEQLRDAYREAQKEAYNTLLISGENSDGNDIIKDWKNLHETGPLSYLLDFGDADVGGQISVAQALEQLKAVSQMTAEQYRNIENALYFDPLEGVSPFSKVEQDIANSGYLNKALGIDWNVTEEEFEEAKKQARILAQTYQAEIDSSLKNVRTLANAFLMTNSDYSELDEQAKNAASIVVNSINASIANDFDSKTSVGAYVDHILTMIKDNSQIHDALIGLFTLDTDSLPIAEALPVIDEYINYIARELGEDPLELKIRLGFEDMGESYKKLRASIRLISDQDGLADSQEFSRLSEYTKDFSASQTELWLEATNGARNAAQAILLYEERLRGIPANRSGFSGFTDQQSKAIDDFQSKVQTLGQARSTHQSGGKVEFTDLVQEFPELQGHTEDLEDAIQKLINHSLDQLYSTLGEGLPDDVKEDLRAIADEALGITMPLDEAFYAAQKSYGALQDFEDALGSGSLAGPILSSVGSLSASLNDMVAGFYAGTVSADELYQALSRHYQNDLINYSNALIAKNQDSQSFWNAMGMSSAETVNTFLRDYGIDLRNCETYNQAKEAIERQTLEKVGGIWKEFYDIQTGGLTSLGEEIKRQAFETDDPAAWELYEQMASGTSSYQKSLKDTSAALDNFLTNSITSTFREVNNGFTTAANGASSAGEQEKQAVIETIDWIERKNQFLKESHDSLMELANDETASYEERRDALKEVIEMDKERAESARQSAQRYEEEWEKAIEGLKEEDIRRIQEGDIDIAEYEMKEGGEYGEGYTDRLKKAMEIYDQKNDMEKEANEIEKEQEEHIREEIRLQGELIDAQQELLSLELERAKSRVDMAEASGKAVTEAMYRNMISASRDTADSYRDKIDNLEDLLDEADEDSDEYYAIQAQIAKCEQSIADCKREQAEWNDAIKRIPIDRINKYIAMLRNIKQDLQNFLDEQSAMGLEPSPEQLQQMMSLSEEEIKKLLEQQEKLQKLLPSYEYGSEKFEQTSQEIQEIDNQISSLIQSQMEYNEAILQMPIDQMKHQSDLLSHARSDLENYLAQQESGGVSKTLEQYQTLFSLSKGQLENLAAQKEMLTALLGVYDPDSTRYQETQAQIQSIEDSISSLVQEQAQWNEEILQMPMDKLQSYVDSLSNARSDLENGIAQQEAQGLGKTLEQYQALQSMSMRQLDALARQKAALLSVMEVYDKDSDRYKESQSRLQGIEDSMSSLIQEQIQWNHEILQIPIQKMQDYSNSLTNARTDLENSIAEQEAGGLGKTMEQYKALQSMSMRQIENLSRQKEMLSSLLDVYDKDSSQYAETQEKIQEIENNLSSLAQEQARWNQELLRIPIDKITGQSGALSNARSDLENSLAQQESQGIGKTLEQYQALFSVSGQQIQLLTQKKEMLTALLDVYDKDSDIYSQTQDELQGVEDSISSLIQEQLQWNQELTRIPIDKMKEYSDSLDSVKSDLKEFMDTQNARGIAATPDQYQQLNAVTLAQLEALRSRKEMLTQLMGQSGKDSDIYKTASQEIREADSAIQSLVRDQYEWNKAILQLPMDSISGINDELNRYSSVLGDVLSDYDTALSAVNGVLDEQIEKINETREASEKAYEDKRKPIQDELDLLKKQNDQRSVQLALEKAAYDLDRAKNQKTTQVIRDGQLQYEADADALRQASEEKSQAEYNQIVYDLEKQLENLTEERDSLLEGYDTQIEQLEKIQEKWSSITDEIKLASDLMKAEEIFGAADWRERILSGDDAGLFDPFQKMYESISAQKEQTENQIASNERISQMIQLFVEQYQSGAITYSEAMSRISQLTDAMSGGYSAMEQLSGLMSWDGIKDLSQITSGSAEKISAAMDSLSRYMDMVQENNRSIQDYASSWDKIQADIEKRLADLQSPPVSQEAFLEYLEAAKASKQELDQYIQSWQKVRDSVDDQVSALKATAGTMEEFRQYLEMVRENEDELAAYIQSWETVKDSVDRQAEALDNASMSLEEFQKYLEAVKSSRDDLSAYTQTWSAIEEDAKRQTALLEDMAGAFSDIQEFINIAEGNENDLERYTQTWDAVRDGVESQVNALDSTAKAMEQFREHLETYQANAEGISNYTSTWEKIKDSIAQQVEALKKAAESLDGVGRQLAGLTLEELIRRYPGAYEQGGLIRIPIGGDVEDDGKGWGDDKAGSASYNTYRTASRKSASQRSSAQSAAPDSSRDSAAATDMPGLRPLMPGEFPLLDLLTEAMSGQKAQEAMFTDVTPMYEAACGKNLVTEIIRLSPQPYRPQNTPGVSFNGDIVVQGVQNPDAFAKALYRRIEPAMNQNFSKIFG